MVVLLLAYNSPSYLILDQFANSNDGSEYILHASVQIVFSFALFTFF